MKQYEPPFVTLTLSDGTTIKLATKRDRFDRVFIDTSVLFSQYGVCAYDVGLQSTAICQSAITFINGEKGTLLYRGYPIEQLAEQHDFTDVSYLLLYGERPTGKEKEQFTEKIRHNSAIQSELHLFLNSFQHDAHPMSMLLANVAALSSFYQQDFDINQPEQRKLAAVQLIAKIPTLAAMAYQHSLGRSPTPPQDEMGYAENFLHMLHNVPGKQYTPHPLFVKALDTILTLHADHEQNASTSSVRAVASTGSNPFACVCAGLAALWGPAHGGANEACLKMLQAIGDESHIDTYIKRAKNPDDPFRLMGFGHRVYKYYDPRAKIMQKICHDVLKVLGNQNDPLFKLANSLEKIALEDDYFVERKLYPNVDFYSGIVLKALGIPANMFTVIFAIARTTGWMAHWLEMMDSSYRINRPRQIYLGFPQRDIT